MNKSSADVRKVVLYGIRKMAEYAKRLDRTTKAAHALARAEELRAMGLVLKYLELGQFQKAYDKANDIGPFTKMFLPETFWSLFEE